MKETLRVLLEGALRNARAAGRLPERRAARGRTSRFPARRVTATCATNVAMVLGRVARDAACVRCAEAVAGVPRRPERPARDARRSPGPASSTSPSAARLGAPRLLEIVRRESATDRLGAARGCESRSSSSPRTRPGRCTSATAAAPPSETRSARHPRCRRLRPSSASTTSTMPATRWRRSGARCRARYLEVLGESSSFPRTAIPGDYVVDLARELVAADGKRWVEVDAEAAAAHWRAGAASECSRASARIWRRFGIRFDRFVSERALREAGVVERGIEDLRARGRRSTRKTARSGSSRRATATTRTGRSSRATASSRTSPPTSDTTATSSSAATIVVIDVWGADHHGYIARIEAALKALGRDPARLRVVLVQIVNLTRDGVPVRMGKRSGEFVALARRHRRGRSRPRALLLSDAQFRLSARLRSRARATPDCREPGILHSVRAHAHRGDLPFGGGARHRAAAASSAPPRRGSNEPEEIALIKLLDSFPDVVEGAASALEPHRVVFYAQRLAGEFHRFYSRHQVRHGRRGA